MVAFYVKRNISVPYSSAAFQKELKERFVDVNGMIFTKEQATLFEQMPDAKTGVSFANNLSETPAWNIIQYLYLIIIYQSSVYHFLQRLC